ncbi:MAG TPA: hypothetical protein VLC95_09305, partial [Anaerolineae bacterium]|nr:hypothetical protein [Anaerolineae bacterium]
LDIGWGFYEGSASALDLDAPISQPFSVSGLAYFWLVSAAVPTTTADGPYSIVLSATAVMTPADARWASDLIWVGDWVAPPLPTTRYRTYLPIVAKSHEDR